MIGHSNGRGNNRRLTYRDAGVDIDAQDQALDRIKHMVRQTFDDRVLRDIGSFGAMYQPFLPGSEVEPSDQVLVSSADGVGTKLKIAFLTGTHNTVGKDLVCHCVNDILVQGAEPLFFMDYLATGTLEPDVVVDIVSGLVDGCKETGCSLIGGETAEMPDFYGAGEYDLAGFIVGLVRKSRVLDGRHIAPGDVVIGLPSSGLHTNGYSLARKVFFDVLQLTVDSEVDELGCTVGDELLKVHRQYRSQLQPLIDEGIVKGLAHITGGGLTDNLPRILPEGCGSVIRRSAWEPQPVFRLIQRAGNVDDGEMMRTFNMGIGMALVVGPDTADTVVDRLAGSGENAVIIGEIVAATGGGVCYV